MPRIKKQVIEAPQANQLNEIAREVANASSALKKIEAEMEAKIAKIRHGYQAKIEDQKNQIKEGTELLEAYALEHRSEFEKKRRRDLVHGFMGFRISTPSVKVARGLSKKIVGILEAANYEAYLRTKKELDKEKIIATRQDEETMAELAKLGITVQQSESFYFEPKEEEVQHA